MSIQGLANPQAPSENRRTASRASAGTSGSSFQSQLEQASTAAAPQSRAAVPASENDALTSLYQDFTTQDPLLSSRSAYGLDSSTFLGNGLIDLLYNAKVDLLDRMEDGKEKTEEEQAWNRLMAYVDAWIASIKQEAEMNKEAAEKAARAYEKLQKELQAKSDDRKHRLADELLDALREHLTL